MRLGVDFVPISEQYIKTHKISGSYISENAKNGYASYNNQDKWQDFVIDSNLVFSHRINTYTHKNFKSSFQWFSTKYTILEITSSCSSMPFPKAERFTWMCKPQVFVWWER